MKLKTTRFGDLEVQDGEVFTFPEGLLGFADLRKFALLNEGAKPPFRWLQSTEEPSLAFVVGDPGPFFPEYRVKVRQEDLSTIQLPEVGQGLVLVIMTVPADPKQMTANLMGPLVINPQAKLGRQLVLAEPGVTTKHRVFKENA